MNEMKYKIDRRYKQFDGKKIIPCVFTNLKTEKRVKRVQRKVVRGFNYAKIAFCLSIITASWLMCYSNNKQGAKNAPTLVQAADEVPRNTLPREIMSRDIPAGYVEPDLFDKYFGKDAKLARAICKAESGLNEKAVSKPNRNKTIDYGICQVNTVHLWRVGGDYKKLLDKETNIRVSAEIMRDNGGFAPWTCFKNGSYKKYLEG